MRALDHYVLHSPLAPFISLDMAMAESSRNGRPAEDIEAPFTPIEDVITAGQAAAAVRRFVRSLPAHQRDLIVRCFWNGESQAQIARVHGVSGAAISKSINKILERGRRSLSPYRNTPLHVLAA